MNLEIEKNNRKTKCCLCWKQIITKHKVRYDRRLYHLSCLYEHSVRRFKMYREMKNKLQKYHKYFMLEKL